MGQPDTQNGPDNYITITLSPKVHITKKTTTGKEHSGELRGLGLMWDEVAKDQDI